MIEVHDLVAETNLQITSRTTQRLRGNRMYYKSLETTSSRVTQRDV